MGEPAQREKRARKASSLVEPVVGESKKKNRNKQKKRERQKVSLGERKELREQTNAFELVRRQAGEGEREPERVDQTSEEHRQSHGSHVQLSWGDVRQ